MSSRIGGGPPNNGGNTNASAKGKGISEVSGPAVNQLSNDMGDMSLNSTTDSGWEVFSRKSRNKPGSSVGKPWPPQNQNPKAWGQPEGQKVGLQSNGLGKGPSNAWKAPTGDSGVPNVRGNAQNQHPLTRGLEPNYNAPQEGQKVGLQSNGLGKGPSNAWKAPTGDSGIPNVRGNAQNQQSLSRGLQPNYSAPQPPIRPPLQRGWDWNNRGGLAPNPGVVPVRQETAPVPDVGNDKPDEVEDDDNDIDYASDDDLVSDDYDSDESIKSHETRKKNKWFSSFFEILDTLTVEQISEPARQWHCPACQNGPGAIDWYRGLQPLMTHAKTKGSKRVKLHREFADLLDEELRRRGTSVIPAGEVFGKWKVLKEVVNDRDIVWPPMVMIMNTQLEQDDNDKWIGMGNQELLDYFSSFAAIRARHSYGPQGHRGISVLIFESSAVGYMEAERLSKHFEDQGTHRENWEQRPTPILYYPGGGGKRLLYGFMAEKRDLDIFNQHSHGKSQLKFEIRSYQEMVVKQMKQMSEDNQQLMWFKNKVAKEQKHSKALEESYGLMSEKLRKTLAENRLVRERAKKHHEENKSEMDSQEKFFNDQIKVIHEARDAKEDEFERIQQEERAKVERSYAISSSGEDHQLRAEKFENFVKLQEKERGEYEDEKEKLVDAHMEKMRELKLRHRNEVIELEQAHDAELSRLMQKYTPRCQDLQAS